MNTLQQPTPGTKKPSSQTIKQHPLAVKSHVDSLNVHNDYWNEWSANREAALPASQRKAMRFHYAQIGKRLLCVGVAAGILFYLFHTMIALR